MNHIFIKIFVLILFFSNQTLNAQFTDSLTSENNAFVSDEELYYNVAYGIIKGGKASLTIRTVPVGDSYLYHIKAVAESAGMVGALVNILDIYESYVDIATGYPIKSVRNITEHKYTSYNEVLFFREQGFVRSLKSGDKQSPDSILDVLSAFYYVRKSMVKNELKKDQVISLLTFFDDQFLPIEIKFKEIEIIKTDFGKIKCMKFVPYLINNKLFTDEEQFQLWVTADKNYIPVKIRVKLPIGSLKCDLTNFKGINDENGELKKK